MNVREREVTKGIIQAKFSVNLANPDNPCLRLFTYQRRRICFSIWWAENRYFRMRKELLSSNCEFPFRDFRRFMHHVGRLYEAKLVCFRLDSSVYIRKMKNKIHISELLDIWVLNNNKIQVFMRVPISSGVLIRVTFTTVSKMKAQMRLSWNLDPKYLKGSREICPSHAPCNHEAERFPRCRWLGGRGVDLKYKHLPFNM